MMLGKKVFCPLRYQIVPHFVLSQSSKTFVKTIAGGYKMFRLWAKVFKDNRLLKDTVICDDDTEKSRTKKIFDAVTAICLEFDLSEPIWLESTIKDFQLHDKTRFTSDNFIESIDFDFLEIQVIEE